MQTAAAETTLIAFTLPSGAHSLRMARFYVRAALGYHDLGSYADDAEMVTSELVTNAITHTRAPSFGLEVICSADPVSVAIIVTDTSPEPPVKHHPSRDAVNGRGLIVVDTLSAAWGWHLRPQGKAVYAILMREA